MKRALLLAAAAATFASPALARPVDPGFNATQVQISRDAPYSIRQCKTNGQWGTHVCYNQGRSTTISVAGILPTPFTRSAERIVRVDCRSRVLLPPNSIKGQVAAEYCPQMPGLAPAPFLQLR